MKGVILAQPKSASTSLMATISKYSSFTAGQQMELKNANSSLARKYTNKGIKRLGLEKRLGLSVARLARLRDILPALDFPILARFHSDICDFGFDPEIASEFAPVFDFHKQHFPPTVGNIRFLKGVPKIILLRNAEDTLDSYGRVPQNRGLRNVYLRNEEFVSRLKTELKLWQDGWLEAARHNAEFITLDFDQLTNNFSEAIGAVESHLGIEISRSERVKLQKERYYR